MATLLSFLLASYLSFSAPNMRLLYGLGLAIVAIAMAMGLFRALGKLRESRQVQRSSWVTYERIAKVKGLSRIEIQLLTRLLRRARAKRPSQILGTIQLYDRLLDQALDRGWILDDDHAHLESARQKLLRSSQKWDGRTNRRQFERAPCAFEVLATAVTREALDAELKTGYEESDEKFRQALDGLVAEGRGESTRIMDLSAGGLSLLAGDKGQFHHGDYLALSPGTSDIPFDITPLRARILDLERMEDQRQVVLHAAFLPFDVALRKQVITAVYEAVESASTHRRDKRRPKRAARPRPKKKKPAAPAEGAPAAADEAPERTA